MNSFFSSSPIWQAKGIAILRIIIGLLLVYHGQEVFNRDVMKGYEEWEAFKGTTAQIMVYAGKAVELLAGISLLLGLFTRVGCVLIIGTFAYITFILGHGKFWYEDQHPFMFFLFGVLFMFTGPGAWSLDGIIFKEDRETD